MAVVQTAEAVAGTGTLSASGVETEEPSVPVAQTVEPSVAVLVAASRAGPRAATALPTVAELHWCSVCL